MSAEQKHKDRLSALDASFLTNERSGVHLHAGALLIFEGSPPTYPQLVSYIESRAHRFPRLRQKLASPPFKIARPIWIDDVDFDIEYHIHETDLPQPGSEKELQEQIGRIFSRKLDYTKPLWELWLVRGLSEDRFALICKLHHSLVDGISGVNLSTVLFDLEPTKPAIEPSTHNWIPQPEPTKMEMIIDALHEYVQHLLSALRFFKRDIKHPAVMARRGGEALAGLVAVARALLLEPAPRTFLNAETGQSRSLEWTRFELDQFKRLKNKTGTTVNDVILAVVARALAKFFSRRGHRTEQLELVGLVPVSIRTDDDHSLFGNRITAIRGPLPLDVEDPTDLLGDVHRRMDEAKQSKQLTGANAIVALNDLLPPILLAQTSRVNFSRRLFNLIVTNVPGLQSSLYVQGRQLLDFFPITCLPRRHALAISILSYNGTVNLCLLADRDILPDMSILREDVERSVEELLEAVDSEPVQVMPGSWLRHLPTSGEQQPV